MIEEDEEGDTVGHGTACAGIVRSLAPECSIVSVRVLGGGWKGSGRLLVAGLRWAIEQGIEVVNMSLSTTKRELSAVLHELADEAYFNRTLLVAASSRFVVERLMLTTCPCSMAHRRPATSSRPLPFQPPPSTRTLTMEHSGASERTMPAHAVPWPTVSPSSILDHRLLPGGPETATCWTSPTSGSCPRSTRRCRSPRGCPHPSRRRGRFAIDARWPGGRGVPAIASSAFGGAAPAALPRTRPLRARRSPRHVKRCSSWWRESAPAPRRGPGGFPRPSTSSTAGVAITASRSTPVATPSRSSR